MKEQSQIPISKVQRASKFVKTGAKVGRNYIKYYGKKLVDPSVPRESLDEDNAEDIYNSLSKLKGSALKVAQMLALDKNLLPQAYQNKFVMAQYSAPPLSFPLVVKTFRSQLGKSPSEIFDSFTKNAVNAASIGQVHQATLGGKKLAVKVQYPGVADSITSDLKLVKPIAHRMLSISKRELEYYLSEVQGKLIEETDYTLELERSEWIAEKCSHISDLFFAKYYPEYSSDRILTMDWLEGDHLEEFMESNPSQEIRNRIGQALWDFYDYQIHQLRLVHADPHPGNFLINQNGHVGILDFGCVKEIPEDFYINYFKLLNHSVIDRNELMDIFYKLNFLYEDDTQEDIEIYIRVYQEMSDLLGRPFHGESFDFSDNDYFNQIFEIGQKLSKMEEFRNSKHPRGAKDGIYINRTYFGLYNLLNRLGATVMTSSGRTLKKAS